MRNASLASHLVLLGLLVGCADGGATPEPAAAEEPVATDKPFQELDPVGSVSQVAPRRQPVQTQRLALTANGEQEESAEPVAAENEARGNVALEPDIWDPNAFTRPRRRMTVRQLDLAIRDATGGIGWDDADDNSGSSFHQLAPTLGVPDYFRRVQLDLTPGMTFQKFLSDGANSVCATLINTENQLPADERVFLVHIGPETNPLSAPLQTDANIKMLLLRFHGKSVALADSAMQPWRDLVNNVAGNVGPNFGAWMEAWNAMCVALLSHPDFYSY